MNDFAQKDNWSVYMIRCTDNSLYTGISTDPYRRLQEHKAVKAGHRKGAKYFYAHSADQLVYLETCHNRSSASKRECYIKKLTVEKKQALIVSEQNQLGMSICQIATRD